MHHDIELTKKGEAYALRANPTGCPAGIDPRLWREAVSKRVETHLALATALLGMLDGMDGDCDLEDGADDEPSFGLQVNGECELELDTADDEPSLGAPEARTVNASFSSGFVRPLTPLFDCIEPVTSQASWGCGTGTELEQDIQDEPHDGELDLAEGDDNVDLEDNGDFEPSLGSPELNPTYWAVSTAGLHRIDGSQIHWADGHGDMEEEFCNEDGDDADFAA